MRRRMPSRESMFLTCIAMAVLAGGAEPAAPDILEEVAVPGTRVRERERGLLRNPDPRGYLLYLLRKDGSTRFQLSFLSTLQDEVRFRRQSSSMRLLADQIPLSPVRLDGDRLHGFDRLHTDAILTLEDNIQEEDGFPASIPFGPGTSLVNIEYLRVQGELLQTHVTVVNAMDPQTRRCEEKFALLDDGQEGINRFILLAESLAHCRRTSRQRDGDLVFANNVPEQMRNAVRDLYGPVAVRFSNKLGSEPGLVYVSLQPESSRGDFQFERSWNRGSLLVFNGRAWQAGFPTSQREAIASAFVEEQVRRRFRQSERPGSLTESAAGYLLALASAERRLATKETLMQALPVWIEDCREHLNRHAAGLVAESFPMEGCGLLVQFIYDAVARARSSGSETVHDIWRSLLNASYRRGESGASTADFLASSKDAHRIVRGLIDRTVDWGELVTTLEAIGVRISLSGATEVKSASVSELKHFRD